MCDALMLKEKSGLVCILDGVLKDNGIRRLDLCLVGKVLSTKLVKKDIFISVFSKIWKVSGGVEIETVEGNVLPFISRIIWTVVTSSQGALGALIALSLLWKNQLGRETSRFLGRLIGEVREVDLEIARDEGRRFLRVRVAISIDVPLRRCLQVDLLGKGLVTTLLLRYERLTNYCFKCGLVGHILSKCPDDSGHSTPLSDQDRTIGAWLRAISPPKLYPFGGGQFEHNGKRVVDNSPRANRSQERRPSNLSLGSPISHPASQSAPVDQRGQCPAEEDYLDPACASRVTLEPNSLNDGGPLANHVYYGLDKHFDSGSGESIRKSKNQCYGEVGNGPTYTPGLQLGSGNEQQEKKALVSICLKPIQLKHKGKKRTDCEVESVFIAGSKKPWGDSMSTMELSSSVGRSLSARRSP
ncbi:hypothetical protein Dsin_014071 [Dipteronia sinensis]|uniref:CCHC-type domain-containing protein n=1 Tax=Dipteronia sinensis TaxID=43782 RepID=A0AAE0E9K9_9ROSI|nr:hypothetical protein Dsin_014071 [Dipteronia sinensis]